MEIKMNLKETFSYKIGIISDILVMTILYFSCLVLKGFSSIANYYQISETTSKGLVLQGYIFWSFAVLIISTISNSIRIDSAKGTLEQKTMSLIPIQILLLGSFISNLIINIIVLISVIFISTLFLGIQINLTFTSIVILFEMLLGMYGLSLVLAGLSLISKRINNLIYIFEMILLFVSNAVMHVNGINIIGNIFPISIAIKISRNLAINNTVTMFQVVFFTLICTLWIIIGTYVFQLLLNYSKNKGYLSQY